MTTVQATIPLLHVCRYHGVTPLNPGSPALAQLARPMSFVEPILTSVKGEQALLGNATYPAPAPGQHESMCCRAYLKDFRVAGAQLFGQPIIMAALQFNFVFVNNCRHTTIGQLLSFISTEEMQDTPIPQYPKTILATIQSAKDEVVRRLVHLENLPDNPLYRQGDAYKNWTQIFDVSSEFVNHFGGFKYDAGQAIPFYSFDVEGDLNSGFLAHRILAFSPEYPFTKTNETSEMKPGVL